METVNWNDSDMEQIGFDIGGGAMYHYKGKPFTGILVESDIRTETQFVNGYVEGITKEFHPNGQLMSESFMKYNLLYGIAREWDENGNLTYQIDRGPEPMR